MKSFLFGKILLLSFTLVIVQCYGRAEIQNDELTKIANVSDLTMLQMKLNIASGNRQPDIIQIDEGVYDLSLLSEDLYYYPLPYPKVNQEEIYPITIIGAGAGKTIFDAGNSVRKFAIFTAQLKDDTGASITVKGITFRNGESDLWSAHTGLFIGTKKGNIEVRECEFLSTNGSYGSTLSAYTGTKHGLGGFIRVISCIFDNLATTVNLNNLRGSTFVEESKFTNFRYYTALDIITNAGVSYISKCIFTNNHSTEQDAPLNAVVWSGGTVEINESTFENNRGSNGGAIRVTGEEATVNIFKNSFTANTGGSFGGAAQISMTVSGKIIIDGNLFKENNNNTRGGALGIFTVPRIDVDDSKVFVGIYNNIFAKNRAASAGGGVYIEIHQQGAVEIINNTIVENTTFTTCNKGAGLDLNTVMNNATAVIYNNIFWNNKCKNNKPGIDLLIDNDPNKSIIWGIEPDGIGARVLLSHNIIGKYNINIEDNVEIENQLNVDPLLNENFKLTQKSPAIDSGTALGLGKFGAEDFEGKSRVIDGNGDGKAVVDIGAIEYKKE